jgi:hypothetical protein
MERRAGVSELQCCRCLGVILNELSLKHLLEQTPERRDEMQRVSESSLSPHYELHRRESGPTWCCVFTALELLLRYDGDDLLFPLLPLSPSMSPTPDRR